VLHAACRNCNCNCGDMAAGRAAVHDAGCCSWWASKQTPGALLTFGSMALAARPVVDWGQQGDVSWQRGARGVGWLELAEATWEARRAESVHRKQQRKLQLQWADVDCPW
jgi:hypothetical protein